MIASSHSEIVTQWIELGLIPNNCTKVTITAEVGKAVKITSEMFAEEDDILKVCDALRDNPEEVSAITREVILMNPFCPGRSVTAEYEVSEPLK